MKKLLACVLILVLTVALCSFSVIALAPPSNPDSGSNPENSQNNEIDDRFKYMNMNSNDGVTISGVNTEIKGELVIPSFYQDKPVTHIGEYAFYNCEEVTSVVIPDSVVWIGDGAFEETAYYKNESNWDNGILYIGKHLIKAEESVSGEVAVKDGTLTVASGAFRRCEALNSVILPDSVVTVGQGAFSSCGSLKKAKLGDKVQLIGHSAFWECNKLSEINIPASVTKIDSMAFEGCENLTSIVLPEGIVKLGSSVFEDCKRLSSVILPDKLTAIPYQTFKNCSALNSIDIPKELVSIEGNAFTGCGALASLSLPDSLWQIGDYAFSDCRSLTSIDIPDSVVAISDGAFADCTQLETVCYSGNEAQKNKLTGGYADYCFETVVWEIAENNSAIFNNKSKADLGAWAIVLIVVAIIVFGTVFVLVADKKKK